MINPLSQEEIAAALIDALKGGLKSNPETALRFAFPNFASHVDALLHDVFS